MDLDCYPSWDSAWEHAEESYNGDKLNAKCIYCGHVVQGITRLKYHLANIKGIVKVCPSVPYAVSQGFRANFENDPADGIMKLKVEQKWVPLVEDGHGEDDHSNEPTPCELMEMEIQRKEDKVQRMKAELHKAEVEIVELKKKHFKRKLCEFGYCWKN